MVTTHKPGTAPRQRATATALPSLSEVIDGHGNFYGMAVNLLRYLHFLTADLEAGLD